MSIYDESAWSSRRVMSEALPHPKLPRATTVSAAWSDRGSSILAPVADDGSAGSDEGSSEKKGKILNYAWKGHCFTRLLIISVHISPLCPNVDFKVYPEGKVLNIFFYFLLDRSKMRRPYLVIHTFPCSLYTSSIDAPFHFFSSTRNGGKGS